MNRPPMTMHVKIKNHDTKFGIWIPLFIIFPILAILFIALAPLALLAAIIVLPFGYARAVLCAPLLFSVLCAMRGLEVDIKSGNNETVLVSVK
ncbi:MAG: hypothetical protein JW712_10150 [Dehalococcoidales bacterium]|nr:hypothetical protein [Dehalococcoidales bacterium]